MASERQPWAMPEWMEPYRELLESDLGGGRIEDLLNDHQTNAFNNHIRAALICMADAKAAMLTALQQRGLLAEGEAAQPEQGDDGLTAEERRKMLRTLEQAGEAQAVVLRYYVAEAINGPSKEPPPSRYQIQAALTAWNEARNALRPATPPGERAAEREEGDDER